MCFVVHKNISELECAILSTLFLPVQKTPTPLVYSVHMKKYVGFGNIDDQGGSTILMSQSQTAL
jgi:hypothetical protein